MNVVFDFQPYMASKGPVQLFAPTTPPGDYAATQFACAPNPGGIEWP